VRKYNGTTVPIVHRNLPKNCQTLVIQFTMAQRPNNYGIGFRVKVNVRHRVRASVRVSDTQLHYSAIEPLCAVVCVYMDPMLQRVNAEQDAEC